MNDSIESVFSAPDLCACTTHLLIDINNLSRFVLSSENGWRHCVRRKHCINFPSSHRSNGAHTKKKCNRVCFRIGARIYSKMVSRQTQLLFFFANFLF